MKRNEIIRWSAVAINVLNIILVAVSIASFFKRTGDGNMAVSGTNCFRYFTIDSNILAAVTSVVVLPFLFRKDVPMWVIVFKYVGMTAVTVTFLTVVFFLGPTQGYETMFDGVCLYLHLICPLLTIISVYLPEIRKPLPKHSWLFGTLPVVVYGAIYAVMVLITKQWLDFYGFTRGGFWYISLIAMYLLSALLSFLLMLLQKKTVGFGKKQ